MYPPDDGATAPKPEGANMTAAELRERTDHWVEPPFAPEPPALKEYVVRCVKPGVRMSVTHTLPNGTVKVYYVSWGTKTMHCTCPDATTRPHRQGKCKHCEFVARLIGRPHLASLPDPNF